MKIKMKIKIAIIALGMRIAKKTFQYFVDVMREEGFEDDIEESINDLMQHIREGLI